MITESGHSISRIWKQSLEAATDNQKELNLQLRTQNRLRKQPGRYSDLRRFYSAQPFPEVPKK